ncbi:actin-related protein 5 [Enteropsectra breve]|nr:actin-related protein 5 [Enteropsectra breve]
MIDLAEKIYSNTYKEVQDKSSTIVIDNGVYEIRAGFNSFHAFTARNRIYKYKEKVSFNPFPQSIMKSMFDGDVIVNFEVLEHSIDLVLEHLQPEQLDNLIITTTPQSPTENELLDFLFSVYKFNRVQLGYDFIFPYQHHCPGQDCLVVSMKYSSCIVAFIQEGGIAEMYKINFGGKDIQEYINYVMTERYKQFKKSYSRLSEHLRASLDYTRESTALYNQMCVGDYKDTLFLNEEQISSPVVQDMANQKSALNTGPQLSIPSIDYTLMGTDDGELSAEDIKEKRKQNMLFHATLYRIKTKIQKNMTNLGMLIESISDVQEKQDDINRYLENKKRKFEEIKRLLELRNKIRQDSKNKKTKEFQIKHKEGLLTEDDIVIRTAIADAEDEAMESKLVERLNFLSKEITAVDPDFIPFYANALEILHGENIGRQCVNVDLIKWVEIFFDPMIINLEEMGLSEIFGCIAQKYPIKNVLLCGGFSFIKDLEKRIEMELNSLLPNEVHIIKTDETKPTAFMGAEFSPLLKVYTREEYNAGMFK